MFTDNDDFLHVSSLDSFKAIGIAAADGHEEVAEASSNWNRTSSAPYVGFTVVTVPPATPHP